MLPAVRRLDGPPTVTATIDGKPAAVEEALAQAAWLVAHSAAPAIVGLHRMSIEALREAVALAEHIRGRLLLRPGDAQPIASRLPVVQTATLGHVFASDLIVWVGRDMYSEDHPVAQAVAGRRLLASFVDASVDTVLALRERFEVDPEHKRIAAVLPPGCDVRVVSQWHKLAAQVQDRVRLCVFSMPAMDAANARGAHEVVTWQTGVSPAAAGGVDFADGAPRACSHGPADLTIDARDGLTIGPVHFGTPGLVLGLAARVMRCDGVVLWLCDDPRKAPADPMVKLLGRLRQLLPPLPLAGVGDGWSEGRMR